MSGDRISRETIEAIFGGMKQSQLDQGWKEAEDRIAQLFVCSQISLDGFRTSMENDQAAYFVQCCMQLIGQQVFQNVHDRGDDLNEIWQQMCDELNERD